MYHEMVNILTTDLKRNLVTDNNDLIPKVLKGVNHTSDLIPFSCKNDKRSW